MRLRLSCFQCNTYSLISIPVNDHGFYEVVCAKGHTTNYVLSQQHFETLFENGVHAIHDGYYREAISAFAAALERFYEFYVRLISRKNNIPQDEFEKGWKAVSKQSERQLGA